MALTTQEQNFVSNTITIAQEYTDFIERLREHVALWNLQDMFNQITDGELDAIPDFSYLTMSNLTNVISNFSDTVDNAGDYETGFLSNMVKVKP